MHATAIARRTATLFGISILAACASSAPRQEVEPVFLPDNIGARRLVGQDSAWVITGRAYEVASPIQAPLHAAQTALDDAARDYRRYFDDDPPLVRVVIDTVSAPAPIAAGAPPGTGEPRMEHVTYSLSGSTRVVHLTTLSGPPRVAEQQQPGRARGQFRAPPLPVAAAVVHAWLSSRADVAPSAANHAGAATAPKAEPSAAMLAAATSSNDARIPDWIEVGLATLIVQGGSNDVYGAMLARQKLIPLDSLFHMSGPVLAMSGGGARGAREGMPGETGGMRGGRGGRGGGMIGGGMMGGMRGGMGSGPPPRSGQAGGGGSLFALESAGFAAFVVEREGPAFLGRVADALMTGASVSEAMHGARQLQSDTSTLQKAFEIWLSSYSPQTMGGRRR